MGKDSQHADERIKYCHKCERCYELVGKSMTSRIKTEIVYYTNFPTYGKQKEICKICKGDKYE
tara:strand:+ start:1060 stop:1248 length:189 start_codon:yes stop_codon:yes gene_type:complete